MAAKVKRFITVARMSDNSNRLRKAALNIMHYSGLDRLARPFTGGRGVIFMLHQVTPEEPQAFDPNRILKVTPEFLDDVITTVRASGFDIISIDEVADRLASTQNERPFAVFTLDDGYRDNRDYAYPVFKRHNAPFTIYVPSDYPAGKGDLWWRVLQTAVARLNRVEVDLSGAHQVWDSATTNEKYNAFEDIYWQLRNMNERAARQVVAGLADQAGYDPKDLCSQIIMDWNELREFSTEPLLTIGAHTKGHFAIRRLDREEARRQITVGRDALQQELGKPVRHFSFPYGCELAAGPHDFQMVSQLGFETAVTTRKGLLQSSHATQLTALPRLSLNGDFQDSRYVKVLLSGAPFALFNAINKVRTPSSTFSEMDDRLSA